ncbi:MAG: 3-isopropylmalate dehydratase small subunit [Thermoanaerobaculia bacterium]|nr:3-isopropylmalate dehydratase small subunit [Thermoanaerobaculia bacterium]
MTRHDSTAPRFTVLESSVAPLPFDHVDTDQIIPAQFLKTTVREGLGRGLFDSWRGQTHGGEPFVLDDPRFESAQILVAGENFGCGSSREHAPWALLDYGFRAVVSTRFADIFRSNALRNGLLTVQVPGSVQEGLMSRAFESPGALVRIDLERQVLTTPWGEEVEFEVDAFARRCLLEGLDPMGYLLAHQPQIEEWEAANPQPFDTRECGAA